MFHDSMKLQGGAISESPLHKWTRTNTNRSEVRSQIVGRDAALRRPRIGIDSDRSLGPMQRLRVTRGRRSAASLPRQTRSSLSSLPQLWTARAGEYEIVDMDSGRSYRFIRDHLESECDWL